METNIVRFRRAVCGAALACALIFSAVATSTASAEKYPPAPQGEDIAFVQLGTVGELVTLELYREAAGSTALQADEKRTFRRLAKAKVKAFQRLNSLLGEAEISGEDFAVKIPNSVLRSRGKIIALACRFERLLAGLYLSGVQSTIDPPTRLLIGRHLVTSTRNLTILRGLRGSHANLKVPKQLSVEYVGIQFDRYLTIPGS